MPTSTISAFCQYREFLNLDDAKLYYQNGKTNYLIDDVTQDYICDTFNYSISTFARMFDNEYTYLWMYISLYIYLAYYVIKFSYQQEKENIVKYNELITLINNSEYCTSDETDSNDESNSDSSNTNKANNDMNLFLQNIFIQQFVSNNNSEIFYYLYSESGFKRIIKYYLFDTDSRIKVNDDLVEAEETYDSIRQSVGFKYFCHEPNSIKTYSINQLLNDTEVTCNTSFNELNFIKWLIDTKIYSHVMSNKEQLLSDMLNNKIITEDEMNQYNQFTELNNLKIQNSKENNQ